MTMTDNMQRARERISDMVLEVLACEPGIGTCESDESFAHRIAVAAALRLAVPDGWVLVPREPTPEMLDAGWAEGAKLCESGAPDFAAAWTAMLAAVESPK